MFWLIGWIIFGMLVGLIARALVPGQQPIGYFWTMMLGIGGSFVGGLLGYFLVGGSLIQSSGWIGSVIGAVLLLIFQLQRHKRVLAEDPATTLRFWEV